MLSGPGSHPSPHPPTQFHYSRSTVVYIICTTNWLNLLCSPLFFLSLSFCCHLSFFRAPPLHPLCPGLVSTIAFSLSEFCFPISSSLSLFLTGLSHSLPIAKPKNSASVVTVQAGSKSVVVAQCEAADGKPAATIKWLASVGGNHSTSTTNGPDGTVTVRSEYRLVPTAADNGREVTCMVDQRTQERAWTHTLKLSVECKDDTLTDFNTCSHTNVFLSIKDKWCRAPGDTFTIMCPTKETNTWLHPEVPTANSLRHRSVPCQSLKAFTLAVTCRPFTTILQTLHRLPNIKNDQSTFISKLWDSNDEKMIL